MRARVRRWFPALIAQIFKPWPAKSLLVGLVGASKPSQRMAPVLAPETRVAPLDVMLPMAVTTRDMNTA